jgi:hypothetical protein
MAKYCLLPSSPDDIGVVDGCTPVDVLCNAHVIRVHYVLRLA